MCFYGEGFESWPGCKLLVFFSCFYQLRPTVPPLAEMEMIIHGFISSHLYCCNSLFTCLSKTSLDRFQVVQNSAAKLLTKSSKKVSHTTNFDFFTLAFHHSNSEAVSRCWWSRLDVHGQAPAYSKEVQQPYDTSNTLLIFLNACFLFLVELFHCQYKFFFQYKSFNASVSFLVQVLF